MTKGDPPDPILQVMRQAFQADASTLTNVGLQNAYLGTIQQLMTSLWTSDTSDFILSRKTSAGDDMMYYKAGRKDQQLHPAQWNLDRVDQLSPVLDRQYR